MIIGQVAKCFPVTGYTLKKTPRDIEKETENHTLNGSIYPGRGKWSKCGIFSFFWSSAVTKGFDSFNFSLKRFCPWHSKNVFVLVLAHLEPKLELFEVEDIGDDGDDDL